MKLAPALALASFAVGCAPYVDPRPSDRHANVVVDVIDHSGLSGRLFEEISIDGHHVEVQPRAPGSARAAWSVRVRPGEATFAFHTEYSHVRQMQGLETLACGIEPDCRRSIADRDLACTARVHAVVAEGEDAVIQYELFGEGRCEARCLHRVTSPDKVTAWLPCPPAKS